MTKRHAAPSARLRNKSTGFTLMEVLLAMAISAVVLAAITMAIDFHLRVVDRGRRDVEEGQLARALLRRMADDLRSAVRYDPLDVSALIAQSAAGSASAAVSQAASALGAAGGQTGGAGGAGQPGAGGSSPGGGSTSGATSGSSNSGTSGSTSSSESTTDETEDLAQSVVVPTIPGLYGNRYQMQVDVSRLPRIEQYEQMLAANEAGMPTDLVSDVKSVAYYTLDGAGGQGQGLVRREMDRAATAYATNNGGATALDQFQEMLAPEVVGVEFQYFDGTDWYEEWDSTVNKGLPVAVEIALAIAGGQTPIAPTSALDLSNYSTEQPYRVYRLLVHLPASRSAADEEAAASAAASNSSETSTSGTGSTTSSSTTPTTTP